MSLRARDELGRAGAIATKQSPGGFSPRIVVESYKSLCIYLYSSIAGKIFKAEESYAVFSENHGGA